MYVFAYRKANYIYRFLFKCCHINSFCISIVIMLNIKSNENDEWCQFCQAYKSDTHSHICRKNWKETHMSSVQKDIAVTIRQKFIAMTFIYCFILVGSWWRVENTSVCYSPSEIALMRNGSDMQITATFAFYIQWNNRFHFYSTLEYSSTMPVAISLRFETSIFSTFKFYSEWY